MYFNQLNGINMVGEERRILVKELIDSKVSIDETLFHVSARNKGLLIHIKTGRVFSYSRKNYKLIVWEDNVYLEKIYSNEREMVYIGIFDKFITTDVGLMEENKVVAGEGKYLAVSFAGEYPPYDPHIKVRNHILVYAMVHDYEVLKAIGEVGRTHEIHHTFGKKAGNGIENLQMFTIKVHRQLEAMIRSSKKSQN